MAGGFTRTDVEAIAALANLELDVSELELFARQLGDILAYADEVRQVDTANVPPTAHAAARVESDRRDEVRPCLDPVDALANAPDALRDAESGFFFKVPRVLG
jgi:aspartyl-tRNA(Asn)/glutamyl-tRNA(Gln) amidotransferase subunit C